MDNLTRLVAEGAYSCGGSLLLKNQEVGKLLASGFELTDAGKAILDKLEDVTDVVVKPAKSKKKPEPEVAEPTAAEAAAALDAMLGE
jgi:hypothetical protein